MASDQVARSAFGLAGIGGAFGSKDSGAVAKDYVSDERRAKHDPDLYRDFEDFAKAMQKDEPRLSNADAKEFLAEEQALEAE